MCISTFGEIDFGPTPHPSDELALGFSPFDFFSAARPELLSPSLTAEL